jgi:hypothetical protein
MTPEVAARTAKLLRLITGGGPDGEVLAGVSRLRATAIAHDVDWDQILANGNASPALTEEQCSRIYAEGYSRGLADGQQHQPQPTASAPSGRAFLGAETVRVETILAAASKAEADNLLSDFEISFAASMRERLASYGSRTWITDKMRPVVDRLEAKLKRQGYID